MWTWSAGTSTEGSNLYVPCHWMRPWYFKGEAGFVSFVKFFGAFALMLLRSACQT